ncbi:MAG: glycoside hydrolase family 3 C-terminal domain-containing protein [Clostridia bacterium]|nr:glycoside hydrolase family 3 C-terminal domain-containing protein [Clostridia bacterium]
MMDFKKMAKELVARMTLEEKMGEMRFDAPGVERLGIPAHNYWNEALHGVARSGVATVFPQAIGMASSFDTELMNEVATAISDEARAKYNEYVKFGDTDIYQGLTYWSPNINIFRDPRWGRGHETYGEDPCLTGKMGVAFIKGLQGEGKYRKLDATIKHYAVHSGPEPLRHSFDAVVSEEDLYGTYLPAFKYCIENADPSAVMGAYNRVNGEVCCGSPTLLQKILRDEFGFKGYVVSDCGAVRDFHQGHKVTNDEIESAALAVNNGCDMNCGFVFRRLKEAYDAGLISEERITEAAERIMEARLRLGMFADDCEYDNIPYDVVASPAHKALSLKMAESSMVLLKNNGILPLKNVKTLAVIGPTADDKDVLLGNYHGTADTYTTLLRGIQEGFDGKVIYARGAELTRAKLGFCEEHPMREAIIAARRADAVVLCLGITPRLEGEETENTNASDKNLKGDKGSIMLPKSQIELLSEIKRCGKPIVCVHVSGSCMSLLEIDEACDAILQCFYPGAEGGKALANILFGKVSPSARLPVTFYKSDSDLPPFEDYSMKNRTYRFFEGEPMYPFGYGLTYADINEEWLTDCKAKITNNGGMDTDYSVLKYNSNGKFRELCDFKKVHIKVGESVTVDFDC